MCVTNIHIINLACYFTPHPATCPLIIITTSYVRYLWYTVWEKRSMTNVHIKMIFQIDVFEAVFLSSENSSTLWKISYTPCTSFHYWSMYIGTFAPYSSCSPTLLVIVPNLATCSPIILTNSYMLGSVFMKSGQHACSSRQTTNNFKNNCFCCVSII